METLGRLAWGFAGVLPAALRAPTTMLPAADWLDSAGQVARVAAVFVLIVLGAFATARFFGKRYGVLRGGKYLKVVDIVPLGPNRALYLVEVAGAWLLVGVTERQISLIARVRDGEEAPAHPAFDSRESFAAKMTALMGGTWPDGDAGSGPRFAEVGAESDIIGQIERLRMIADRTTGATH